jgi:hypothetical protein
MNFEILDTTTKEELEARKNELIAGGENAELVQLDYEIALEQLKTSQKYGQAIKNHKKMNIPTYILSCESGQNCLLREPTVQESNSVFHIIYGVGCEPDLNKAGKILVDKCWIAGDAEIRKDSNLMSEVAMAFVHMANIKRAEIKKN